MSSFIIQHAWSGSTASADYTRNAITTAPGKSPVGMSAGSDFAGDDSQWNPEELLGASLAQCHLLTFLALAKKIGLNVLEVKGDVEVVLDQTSRPPHVSQIILRPDIHVESGFNLEKAEKFYNKAHRYCFIAQSIKSEVVMAPTFHEVDLSAQ